MAVIAVGGFQHETNTFAPSKADYATFAQGGAWPPLAEGDGIATRLSGANIPAAGALAALHAAGKRASGLVWAAASPTAHVTADAFERIVGTLTQRLAQAGAIDGVYLDLHGAMVTEHLDDGDGEILARVRRIVGPKVPIVASLDLHANVTQRMLACADGLVAYRTYPHVDMRETGARAARLLLALRERGTPLACAMRPLDFLTSLASQSTFIEPGRRLYDLLAAIEREEDAVLSFTPGFPLADVPECQMAVLGYGADPTGVARAVARLADAVTDAEPEFAVDLWTPGDAVAHAARRGKVGAPVVLADTQDNPGAGANGDTTGLLAALIAANPPGAVLGLLIDRASAAQAHALGIGRKARFHLGETSGLPGHLPLSAKFEVVALADGKFTCTGPMFEGFAMQLGPMAVLAHGNVRVVLASKKVQAADQAMFRHVGIEPRRERILALKSSAHFRADFAPLASEILIVAAPGPAPADPAMLPFRRLRPGLRLRPLGPTFVPPRTEP